MNAVRKFIVRLGAPYPAVDRWAGMAFLLTSWSLIALINPSNWAWAAARLGAGERPPAALFICLGCIAFAYWARSNAITFAYRAREAERKAHLTPLQRVSEG